MNSASIPLYTFALYLLSGKDIPEALLLQKIQKKYPSSLPEEQHEVMDTLKQEGYIDDVRFTENFVRWRREELPRGKSVIAQELRKKMVDADTIDRVIEDLIPPEKEYEMCAFLTQKKASLLEYASSVDYKKKEKLTRFLVSKGFSFSLVRECIEDLESHNL